MSNIVQGIKKVLTGNAIAQIISFASLPLLTKLYSPDDIGLGNVILMSSNIAAIIFTLRMDIAIFINSNEVESIQDKIKVALTNIFFLCLITFLIFPLVVDEIPFDVIFIWLNLTICISMYNLFTSQLNLEKKYGDFAKTRVNNTVMAVILKLLFGYLSFGWYGFTIALIVSYAFVIIHLTVNRQANLILSSLKKKVDYRDFWEKNNQFIKFNLTTSVINAFGQFLPVLLITKAYGLNFVGVYTLVIMVMRAPVNLIGESIRKVMMQDFGDKKSTMEFLSIKTTFRKFTLSLVIFSLLSFSVGGVVLQLVGERFLDDDWLMVIPVYWLLAPWFIFLLGNIPASCVFTIFEKHKFLFRYEVCFLMFRIASILIPSKLGFDVYSMLTSFVVINVLFNLGYILISWKDVNKVCKYA
ncbi:hypothetical protein CWN98_12540 [Vibrio splendidus]|uniref:lipopolysaccharide biosynthesis protein n=1 Tax=Vibrio splendidus TaxID=29497 RepID=UPI000D3D5AAF|nr:oligosaccharide flippase family protein [Vibrio splendidus]PTO86893.1 hypothetical protein CWN98_12540 [Vibrio splendidus]PTP47532.1 hypothetical protein CWO10_12005 [Vibrio splendidus]